jgi:hypothetical protein
MNKYSGFEKMVSIVMIFIMLIQFSGCVSTKILSKSDLPVSGIWPYKIRCQKTNFLLKDVEVSNGKLSGKVETTESSRYANIVNIYLASDSVVKINEENILTVPLESITRVKLVETSTAKTFFLVTGITAVIVLLLLNSSFLDFNPLPNGI